MIKAHFRPSDETIERIGILVKGFILDGTINLSQYGSERFAICKQIANEAGLNNPDVNDLVGCMPAFEYHASKFFDKYISEKYNKSGDAS